MNGANSGREPPTRQGSTAPLVEIGWIFVSDRRAQEEPAAEVREAAERVEHELRCTFPHYRFRCVSLTRHVPPAHGRREIVDLIEIAALEREAGHWDFACAVTDEDLRTYDKPFALGAPASALNVCVVSLARLRPAGGAAGAPAHGQTLAKRLCALFFHLFGHLNDLRHGSEPSDYMSAPQLAGDLDRMTGYSPAAIQELDRELGEEADPRVEEEPAPRGAFRFYLAATWRNRSDIAQAVRKASPWSFVFRLSKLLTTATSTLVVLMLTAESWDVGTSQSGARVAFASVAAVSLTALYVLRRQGLLGRARRRDLTEQKVAANVSVALIILVAMATTYVALFGISLSLAMLAFSSEILRNWITHTESVAPIDRAVMAGFVATLGVVLGALGASFEGEKYFRHAAIVDEET